MTDIYTDEEEPWIPEYVYVLQQKALDNPDYTPYGFDQLEIPTDCTVVVERLDWLITRFNERYYYRRLNAETMDRWQILLQDKMDSIVRRYNRAYGIYTDNATLIAKVTDGYVVTDSKAGTSGNSHVESLAGTLSETDTDSKTSNVLQKNIDTPDEAFNDANDYASRIQKVDGSDAGSTIKEGATSGNNTITDSATTSENNTSEMVNTGKKVMDNANANIDDYRDIDTQFIKEFENNFLNVLWY